MIAITENNMQRCEVTIYAIDACTECDESVMIMPYATSQVAWDAPHVLHARVPDSHELLVGA